jgi:nifR3 family TIM-barrel protein
MEFDLAAFLNRPLSIGGRTIAKRLVLAPMTYLGHAAFRELLAGFGGFGLLFSEMCSARTIPTENRHVSSFFKWRDAELPLLVCQIFGTEPERMAEAARRIADEGFFGVDLNYGCATAAICRRSCGAALLKSPDTAVAIVAHIRRAVSIPVMVKFRTGWEDRPDAAVALAQRFEAAGADALTFHPRVAPDRRARPPRWEYIGRVKQAVSIPVFGNGDVFDADGCRRMIRLTGCDGVALGRIAVARPWVFAEWADGVDPGPERFRGAMSQLLALLPQYFNEPAALRRFRRFTLYFAANFRFGHTLHRRMQAAKSLAQMAAVLDGFFDSPPELNPVPNMSFLQ